MWVNMVKNQQKEKKTLHWGVIQLFMKNCYFIDQLQLNIVLKPWLKIQISSKSLHPQSNITTLKFNSTLLLGVTEDLKHKSPYRFKKVRNVLQASLCCSFIHGSRCVYSQFPANCSERCQHMQRGRLRGEEKRFRAKNILTHSLYLSPGCWRPHSSRSRGWLQLLLIVDTLESSFKTNLPNEQIISLPNRSVLMARVPQLQFWKRLRARFCQFACIHESETGNALV